MQNKEIVTDGKINKYMYYQNKKPFIIVPPLQENDKNHMEEHINNLKKSYKKIDEHCTFLWVYDSTNNVITVDNSTKFVESNIFYQFSKIALWLFSRNYDLKGSFWYRTDKIIEYISCDGIGKSITHYVIADEIEPIQNKNCMNEKSIIEASDKIRKFKRMKFFNLVENKNYMVKVEPLHSVANLLARAEESKIVINDMQKRLEQVENKFQSLNKTNKSLWKLCTIMGLISLGTIIFFTMVSVDNAPIFHNSTFNQYNWTTSAL